jgi:hypothetical protein
MTDRNQLKNERQTKNVVIALAREQGVEEQAKKIILKYENAIKGCRTEEERRHIAHQGLAELHLLIGCVGPLVADGKVILPASTGYNEMHENFGNLVKLD